jgi:hypothetical protein
MATRAAREKDRLTVRGCRGCDAAVRNVRERSGRKRDAQQDSELRRRLHEDVLSRLSVVLKYRAASNEPSGNLKR